MNLVIVESPAKGKTIEKYLGKDYKVLASFGHVRDLPSSKIGVDTKKNFEPTYEIPEKAEKTIKALKSAMAKADKVYLATDYDREGEAIAFHLVEALKPKIPYQRITFTEITKSAITSAVEHPREIDMDLVDAQQARRVLDRLVGYKLSPFLWQKVARGLSAGRVQSVAVRLVVEREKEIQKFIPVEYWSIEALLSKNKVQFTADLTERSGKKLDKLAIKSEKEAKEIDDQLKTGDYEVADLKSEDKKKHPSPPFTTSTLQMEAGSKFKYSAKQTMRLAQNLYEDGFITYMRTDSVNISAQALKQAQEVITSKYGEKYALETPRVFKTKSKGAQEAHEAIRPTDMNVTSDKIPLTAQHQKIYELIWKKMMASQMQEAIVAETTAKIKNGEFIFTAKGLKVKFDGFMKLYKTNEAMENFLPELNIGDKLSLEKLDKIQHFTEPLPRYSEGSLIKELEKRGIGRPSTYAPTLSTIQDRGYVEKIEGRFIPKDIGIAVSDILVENFPQIVDYDFTAKMEENLDEIAEGKLKWQPVLKEFYDPFAKNLTEKMESVKKADLQEETDEKCPKCGQNLMIKMGRFGKFMACKGYPECKFTRPITKPGEENKPEGEPTDEKCPKCGKNMVLKESRYGKFLACEGYPECKTTKTITVETDVPCPNCGEKLIQRRTKKGRTFWGCSGYPKCKTAFWNEPTSEKCPECGKLLLKAGKDKIKCSECDYSK
ncbi:TPA: type I DNA topoisomerase [Candidatus Berkelbacteria bacterium]|uniref:DNA topoisomerase 1 n=1 Tax=Berkelbacteria bacterium GW2011_GWE1_39_12 TaxID=1618337 RepID=A0A0G4B211_9BACT|nr:MAG: topoisomerase I, DNA topoisomerase I protein [Berkelbacteria bacterium GW2011_GWE1_39_12]HBO60446.1 type I DNA topoisomerase [Candidatus Berkelbacteria bacterium]